VKGWKDLLFKWVCLADLEKNIPVDPAKTFFRIGSISKGFLLPMLFFNSLIKRK
jgi:CubicO group peptidase (beta-lactamase class C family)